MLTSRKPDDRFWVRLIFPFDEFELTMRREARMVYVDQEHGRFASGEELLEVRGIGEAKLAELRSKVRVR